MNRFKGGVPIPQHQRYTRVVDPTLRGLVPALSVPRENANQTVNKVSALMNRAGSNPRNPVLSGLGGHVEFMLEERDRLISVFFYRRRDELGPDLIDEVVTLGDSLFGLDFLFGSGTTVAGTPVDGAVRNFLRILSKAGAAERVFWVKSYDKDVVTVEGQNTLDDALDPVEIVVNIIDATRDWLDLKIDFFVSWSDEFQVLHNRNAVDVENGNLKSYGGVKFVSLFQTSEDEAIPGDSTEVKNVLQVDIKDQHTLQVENTAGLKHVTARFRSKQNSAYFVDVDFLVRVVAPEAGLCVSPLGERCGEELLLSGTALPAELQSTPSVPMVQDVAGTPGAPISADLFYLAVHANAVGATPTLIVERYGVVASADDLEGHLFQKISELEYKALTAPAVAPDPGPPFVGPKRHTVCFNRNTELGLGVALYVLYLKDGDHYSKPTPFPGPASRDTTFMAPGNEGGIDECFYG